MHIPRTLFALFIATAVLSQAQGIAAASATRPTFGHIVRDGTLYTVYGIPGAATLTAETTGLAGAVFLNGTTIGLSADKQTLLYAPGRENQQAYSLPAPIESLFTSSDGQILAAGSAFDVTLYRVTGTGLAETRRLAADGTRLAAVANDGALLVAGQPALWISREKSVPLALPSLRAAAILANGDIISLDASRHLARTRGPAAQPEQLAPDYLVTAFAIDSANIWALSDKGLIHITGNLPTVYPDFVFANSLLTGLSGGVLLISNSTGVTLLDVRTQPKSYLLPVGGNQ